MNLGLPAVNFEGLFHALLQKNKKFPDLRQLTLCMAFLVSYIHKIRNLILDRVNSALKFHSYFHITLHLHLNITLTLKGFSALTTTGTKF